MKKTMTALAAAAVVAGSLAVTALDASAQWRRHHHHHHHRGWGPGIAAGIIGGAIITGAILATRPRGYVVYEGYDRPLHHRGCYWASEPVYDRYGRVVGYTGEPVQVCPY
jgi:hypothetical protein